MMCSNTTSAKAARRIDLRDGRRGATPAILLDKGRELRALVGHEHGHQFRRFGIAGIRRHQMRRARRFEEGLTGLEGLGRPPASWERISPLVM